MDRIIIDTLWNRKTRNEINENFEYLFEGVGTVNKTITDLVVEAGDANPEVIQARGGETVLNDRLNNADDAFNTHENNENNPHAVTKEQIGLSKVINEKQATLSEFNIFKIETVDQLDGFEGEFNQFKDDFSDKFNDYMSENEFKGVYLELTSNKAIEPSTYTTISWDSAVYNLSNFWNSGDPTKIVVPKGVEMVRVVFGALWESNPDGYRRMRVKKNGEYSKGLPYIANISTGTTATNGSSAVVKVNEGDYFTLEVQQTSGGKIDFREDPYTYFSLEVVKYSKK